jgi:hypothetical protein
MGVAVGWRCRSLAQFDWWMRMFMPRHAAGRLRGITSTGLEQIAMVRGMLNFRQLQECADHVQV